MYKVFFINFGYASANEGKSLDEAIKIARRAGFQSTIYSPEATIVATYCPISGVYVLPRAA